MPSVATALDLPFGGLATTLIYQNQMRNIYGFLLQKFATEANNQYQNIIIINIIITDIIVITAIIIIIIMIILQLV